MPKLLQWAGQRYGSLVVVRYSHHVGPKRAWLCRCDCGEETIVQDSNLRSSHTTSCGCALIAARSVARLTHGKSSTPIHDVWINMKQRCYNSKNPRYPDYGGRGIRVCDEWLNSFEAFFAYLGDVPSPTHTIDRIDNDGNYEPGNVRWATKIVQGINRRPFTAGGKTIDFRGERLTVHTLAKRFNLRPSTIYKRLDNGWTVEDAVKPADQRFASSRAAS